jgi:hypothetical protein
MFNPLKRQLIDRKMKKIYRKIRKAEKFENKNLMFGSNSKVKSL